MLAMAEKEWHMTLNSEAGRELPKLPLASIIPLFSA